MEDPYGAPSENTKLFKFYTKLHETAKQKFPEAQKKIMSIFDSIADYLAWVDRIGEQAGSKPLTTVDRVFYYRTLIIEMLNVIEQNIRFIVKRALKIYETKHARRD